MLKRTLFFGKPSRLSVKDKQLVIESKEDGAIHKVPIEDIGYAVIENQQISFSVPLLQELMANNVAVIFCDAGHMPNSMLLNLDGHHLQNELFRFQIEASEPLKKNLWKQTIEAKIRNQSALLHKLGKNGSLLKPFYSNVKSGDIDNREGIAARIYWTEMYGPDFTRDRYGACPNNLLNYAYIVLRAAVARALTGSGLLATLGIFHHNRYNAFCLADDIMEPYRPFADEIVFKLFQNGNQELTTDVKAEILKILANDVCFENTTRPLMVGLSQTTASLSRCFTGEQKKMVYPELK